MILGSLGFLFLVFVLAIFLGFELITKVPSMLHTPLMSGANAISGITLLGAIALLLHSKSSLELGISFTACLFATINVVGGYAVTQRMLNMFGSKHD